jgi:MFS family permease
MVGVVVAGALSGVISHYMGRRASIWLGCVFINLGTALMMVVDTIGGLYAARFLVGISVGLLFTFFNLYLQVCLHLPSHLTCNMLTRYSYRNAHPLGIVDSW